MSWMDSWSRPSKSQATPPPLYLTIGDSVPYCHTCGRVIGDRKKTSGATEVKYCSQRCRHQKPGPIDRKIEATFAKLLEGATPESIKEEQEKAKGEQEKPKDEQTTPKQDHEKPTTETSNTPSKFNKHASKPHKKKTSKSKATPKGEDRLLIDCTTVQDLVFARPHDPEKTHGRRKNRRARYIVEAPEDWRSVDMVDKPASTNTGAETSRGGQDTASSADESTSDSEHEDEDDRGGVPLSDTIPLASSFTPGTRRPPQSLSAINGSIGGEVSQLERLPETPEAKQRRLEGQQRATEREMVRKAARRGCAFGFVSSSEGGVRGGVDGERRKCEAVMKGVVVEGSFAKGEWGVRWRERV